MQISLRCVESHESAEPERAQWDVPFEYAVTHVPRPAVHRVAQLVRVVLDA